MENESKLLHALFDHQYALIGMVILAVIVLGLILAWIARRARNSSGEK
jgi:hypothetical protein